LQQRGELAAEGDERATRAAGPAWSADDLTTGRKERANAVLLLFRTAKREANRLPLASWRVKDGS
jgi:hypothetical protein